jgi:hypothetical protein
MHVRPGTHKFKWIVALVAIVIIIVSVEMTASQSAGVGERLTADLSLSQTHVTADGQLLPGSAPAARYRLEHRSDPTGATTTITFVELERAVAEGTAGRARLDNPFVAVKMELDPKGGLRLYNRRGDRLREPTAADRRLFGIVNPSPGSQAPDTRLLAGRGGPAQLLIAANRGKERRAELEKRFGAPVERVRGFDRYVASRDGDIDEVLVDPATALPAEVNTVRAGALVSRVQMAYEAKGDTLIRRWFRAERTLADTARRVVTTLDVTNVQVVAGGGQ